MLATVVAVADPDASAVVAALRRNDFAASVLEVPLALETRVAWIAVCYLASSPGLC